MLDRIVDNSLDDSTQIEVIRELKITEHLIEKAIKKETGKDGEVVIYAMPDLGFANNSIRMRGGFYTGMYLRWKCELPFVPVDTTINSCGVSVFKLKKDLPYEEFEKRISLAKTMLKDTAYNWNFERGNHFISICKNLSGENYAVMHASADEYKRSIKDSALYPENDVWYSDQIKTVDTEDGNRYLRYLIGDAADKFIKIAIQLEDINHHRMKHIAKLIFPDILDEEKLYIPHYGMPDRESIAIGCSWTKNYSVLLTSLGKEFYVIEPTTSFEQRKWIVPHGLGAKANDPRICYKNKELYVNDEIIKSDKDIANIDGKGIRFVDLDEKQFQKKIQQILGKIDAKIVDTLYPLYTINQSGFNSFIDNKGSEKLKNEN